VSTRKPAAPPGLGLAGRALWRATVAEFELNPAELALLGGAGRTADTLAALTTALNDAPVIVTGSTGQPRAHPLLAEARAQRRVLDQLCRALALPLAGEDVGRRRSPSAREAAIARWSQDGA
jgi:hypothetical protein